MITVIRNRLQRLNTRLGQHTAEFMILFLALAVAFVGTRLYLRRGVNAKLIQIQGQLNEAVGGVAVPGAPVSVAVHIKVTSVGGGTKCEKNATWSKGQFDLFMDGSGCHACVIEWARCNHCDWGIGSYNMTVKGEGKEKTRKVSNLTSCEAASGCIGINPICWP